MSLRADFMAQKRLDEEEKEIKTINQLKAENEELTTINDRLLGRLEVDETDTSLVFNLDKELRQKEKEFYTAIQKVVKLKQTLAEIKPILEYYEDSKIGEKQEDGSYKLEFTFYDVITPFCIKYDPKPAREALRKINECEVDNEV